MNSFGRERVKWNFLLYGGVLENVMSSLFMMELVLKRNVLNMF